MLPDPNWARNNEKLRRKLQILPLSSLMRSRRTGPRHSSQCHDSWSQQRDTEASAKIPRLPGQLQYSLPDSLVTTVNLADWEFPDKYSDLLRTRSVTIPTESETGSYKKLGRSDYIRCIRHVEPQFWVRYTRKASGQFWNIKDFQHAISSAGQTVMVWKLRASGDSGYTWRWSSMSSMCTGREGQLLSCTYLVALAPPEADKTRGFNFGWRGAGFVSSFLFGTKKRFEGDLVW